VVDSLVEADWDTQLSLSAGSRPMLPSVSLKNAAGSLTILL